MQNVILIYRFFLSYLESLLRKFAAETATPKKVRCEPAKLGWANFFPGLPRGFFPPHKHRFSLRSDFFYDLFVRFSPNSFLIDQDFFPAGRFYFCQITAGNCSAKRRMDLQKLGLFSAIFWYFAPERRDHGREFAPYHLPTGKQFQAQFFHWCNLLLARMLSAAGFYSPYESREQLGGYPLPGCGLPARQ